jgi:hypothetical protein
MVLAMAMRRLGTGDYTPHGMRSASRDWSCGNPIRTEAVAIGAPSEAAASSFKATTRRIQGNDSPRISQ